MRYATEDSPLGTAGSVRNAADELDDTFLVISGDVLTDIDLTAFVKAHRDAGRGGIDRAEAGRRPGRVRHRHHAAPTARSSGSSRSPRGARSSPTRSTPASTCSSPRCSTSSPRARSSTSRATCSRRCWSEASRSTATSPRATGRTSARSRRTSARTPTSSTGRCNVEIDGFRLGEDVWLGEPTSRSTPTPRIDGPAIIGDNCRIEAGAHVREYTVLGSDVVVKHDASLVRVGVHDHVYLGPRRESARLRDRAHQRPARHAAVEEGAVLGDECFVGEGAVVNPDVKVYPFKTVEAGAVVTSSIVWESRGARTLFGRRGVRGLANVDITPEVVARLAMAYGTSLKKGAASPRAATRAGSPARSSARSSAGSTSRASTSRTSSWPPCRSPGSRCGTADRRAGSPCGSRRATPTASRSASSTATAATSTRRRSARSSGCSTARTSGARSAATSATSCSRPARSSSTPPRSSTSSTSSGCGDRAFKVVLDYSFGAASLVMPAVLAKVGADVLAVNPFAAPRRPPSTAEDATRRLARIGELVRASGSDLGMVIDPDGETARRRRRHAATSSSPEELLARRRRADRRGRCPGRASRCRSPSPARWSGSSARRTRWCGPEALGREPHGGRVERPRRLRGVARRRLHLARLPARLRRRGHAGEAARPPRAVDRPLSESSTALPRVHVAHETVVTPWERKGAVMREMVERAKGRRDRARRRREDHPRRRLGAGAARPRGGAHPRVGRGRHRSRGPPPRAGVRASASARSALTLDRCRRGHSSCSTEGSCRAMKFPEELRYSKEHEWVAVEGTRARSGSPTTRRTRSATWSTCSCPTSASR